MAKKKRDLANPLSPSEGFNRGLPIASLPLAMSPGVSSKKKKSKKKKSAGKIVAKAAKSAIGTAVHKASGKSPKMKSKEGLAQERTKRQNTYYKKK